LGGAFKKILGAMGEVPFFERRTDGRLKASVALLGGGAEITDRYRSTSVLTTLRNARFAIHDLNRDGVLDLIFADYRDNYHNPVKICLGTL